MIKLFSLKRKEDSERFKAGKKNASNVVASQMARPFSQAQKLEHINNRGPEGRGRASKKG